MTLNKYYRVRKPDIIFEPFDNEIVVINLENGNYYSLMDIAAETWSLIEGGKSFNGLMQDLLSRYQGDQLEATLSVENFLTELVNDGLIEVYTPDEITGLVSTDNKEKAHLPKFTAPILNRYTDMQKLLLLDPIHDVGDKAWPEQKPDQSTIADK
jgi:hypothetical protein